MSFVNIPATQSNVYIGSSTTTTNSLPYIDTTATTSTINIGLTAIGSIIFNSGNTTLSSFGPQTQEVKYILLGEEISFTRSTFAYYSNNLGLVISLINTIGPKFWYEYKKNVNDLSSDAVEIIDRVVKLKNRNISIDNILNS
jgi:hypothetical protein